MNATPRRRDVLAGGGVAVVAVAVGAFLGRRPRTVTPNHPAALRSTPGTHPPATDHPSGTASPTPTATSGGPAGPVVTAYNAEARLVAIYERVVAPLNSSTGRVQSALADHRRHLEALAAAVVAAAPDWVRPGTLPAAPATAASALATLEANASAAMLALLPTTSGDVAGLLASIAGCEAAHVQLVGGVRKASG